jgi:hypothetical protein
MIETFTRVTGWKAVYASAYRSKELINHFPEFAEKEERFREIIGMAEYAVEHRYFRNDRDLEWSRRINQRAWSWLQFLKTTNWNGDRKAFGLN